MNTREREVMDALATVLREYVEYDRKGWLFPLAGVSDALAAYDALLASSAAGEQAEAVDSAFKRPMFGRMIEADFSQNTATFEMEPGYYAAAGRFEIRRPQPAQGEHEQRSSEGSERRTIAESDVSRACEVFDAATFYSIGGYTFDDYRKRMRAALESALPRGLPVAWLGRDGELSYMKRNPDDEQVGARAGALIASTQWEQGLPAGSVKRDDAEAFLVKYHAQVWEAAESGGEYDYAGRELAKQFLARFDATAEQPSCGQDVRDAAAAELLAADVAFDAAEAAWREASTNATGDETPGAWAKEAERRWQTFGEASRRRSEAIAAQQRNCKGDET